MKAGERLRNKINEAIWTCDYFLIVLSRHSIHSPWVQTELDSAMIRELNEKRVVVIPLVVGRTRICELPPDLQGKLCIDFRRLTSEKYDFSVNELLRALGNSGKVPCRPSGYSLSPNLISHLSIDQIEFLRRLMESGELGSAFDLAVSAYGAQAESLDTILSKRSSLVEAANNLLLWARAERPPFIEKRIEDVGFFSYPTETYMFSDEPCRDFVAHYIQPSLADNPGGRFAFLASYYESFVRNQIARFGELTFPSPAELDARTVLVSGPLSSQEIQEMFSEQRGLCIFGGKMIPPFYFCLPLRPPAPKEHPRTTEFLCHLFGVSGCVTFVVSGGVCRGPKGKPRW